MWMKTEKTGSSTKTALSVDERQKNEGLSTETALYVDERQKIRFLKNCLICGLIDNNDSEDGILEWPILI